MDTVVKAYLQQLEEAAKYAATNSGFETESERKRYYNMAAKDEKIYDLPDGGSVHHSNDPRRGESYYSVLDHDKREVLYTSTFKRHESGNGVNFPHLVQSGVGKAPNTPSSVITDNMFREIKNTGLPLRTDKMQTDGAHKLWKRFALQAMDRNMHVYYHSPEEGLVNLTHDNFDEYHTKYHGEADRNEYSTETGKYMNRHLLVSDKPL